MDSLVQQILTAIRPPGNGDPNNKAAKEIFPVLFGVAVSLIASKDLINANLQEYESQPHWPPETLVDELKDLLTNHARIDWYVGKHFSPWATGFFLNRARQNISAAMDLHIQAFEELVPDTSNPKRTNGQSGDRCTRLANAGFPQNVKDAFRALGGFYRKNLAKSKTALAKFEETAKILPEPFGPLSDASICLLSGMTPENCIVLSVGLNNAFKHEVYGMSRHSKPELLTDWILLFKAFQGSVELWKSLLKQSLHLE